MKVGAIVKEISVILAGMIVAVGLFSLISFILHLFSIKVFDTWLLAGSSLIFGVNYIIFRSPTLATFITNKANIWASTILVFYPAIAGLTFIAIFLIVTLFVQLSLYTINPFMDVSVSLLISILLLVFLIIFLKSKKRSAENTL